MSITLRDCKDSEITSTLLTHQKLTAEEQSHIAENDSPTDSWDRSSLLPALASNPFLIEEIQTKLMVESTPQSGLSRISALFGGSGSKAVREALAANSALAKIHQIKLAEDDSEDVRLALAGNSVLDGEAQLKLTAYYFNGFHRKQLRKSDDDAYEEMENQNSIIRIALAKNAAITENVQRLFEQDTDKSNPDCIEYGQFFEEHSKPLETRIALAGNKSLVHDLQIKLATDEHREVRLALAKNVSLSVEARSKLIEFSPA